ncbi:cytochrome b/b6 domain-containing protein [Sulfitobacter albidus]|uniref:Cytochrome b/b6 domain-containing protein n=1 Tax=Sulfitobacter albidus TaxID=2829501 RepID=A0A975PNE7_9RHOB|nr:cytochrome b/b6 domain-containing protein [Sulfitobacter albidus]QUJ77391.1 cytochrome b/b6 domain-containing protein [Sulfitobacter albidus]
MPLSNTATTYGSVTRAFHWLTALLVITLIPVAVVANRLPYETSEQLATKAWLFSLHKTLGVAVFAVALLRILWAISQPKPSPLHHEKRMQTFLAETAHWLLYGSLVLAPLSGWVHHAATEGFAPIWWPFGQNLPLIPKSESVAAITYGLHWVFGKVMAATIALHILGALKHQLIDRDATLARMTRGATAGSPLSHTGAAKPAAAAVAIWAAVLAGAGAFGLYQPHASTVQAATLDEVASDWAVQEGEIAITVNQFNSDVTGRFADWTAAIQFDETADAGTAGNVETQIAIGSLTLGSVTDQAMGADYFNAADFPTATFTADLIRQTDGYVADGTLTIKDQSVPLTLPFTLDLDGDTARMQAQTTLDRRDFGIGDNMTDESSLKFGVTVDINLTATRAAPE